MKNNYLPADHRPILFTDQQGIQHEGIYNIDLKAFIELIGNDESGDAGNSFMENEIIEWEYLESNKNPDSDLMVIF
ncbi:hypothetical protein [Dyadobacter sp. NIV53]|uniref:hypothetical protein n=1 Tax=Dyadobacter sp. NIV53 TaxID=2861765 RepID=UPI001C86A404|nr:hypothetical protein [Dyadobacter sp. NIV53]